MPRTEKALLAWESDAIELMARYGLSLIEAAGELGQGVTSEECDKLVRRKSFNKLLWAARHRFANELANNPDFKKETVVGKLVALSQKLEDRGDFDKAGEALLKAAKVAGFVGPESTVSVFGELSQADLDQIRKKIEGETHAPGPRPN